MKLFIATAVLAALATVQAASESTVHIRIHVPDEEAKAGEAPVAEWGRCKFEGKPLLACVSGSVCRELDAYSGQCFREPAIQWAQCGGKGWMGTCAVSTNKCTRSSDYYAQCKP